VEGDSANGFFVPLAGYFLGKGVSADDDINNPANGASFSASGYHGAGGVTHVGYRGFVWSAASAGTDDGPGSAYCMGGNVSSGLMYQPREAGFSIRCVRE
jgi:hypothetical protein